MAESRVTIYAAIAANVAIAVTKFIAAAITGSSAMFSEGLHSAVDTGNGLLLLLGLKLSRRAPTPRHPYGHGLEVYFWSLVVAMSIFGMGGIVSVYEGVRHLAAPHRESSVVWSYAVLGAAFAFEGTSWFVAVRSFRRISGDRSTWQAIRQSKDPTTFMVLLEDSAALLGILIAAAGIGLAQWLHEPAYDAIASMLIGALLVVVAVILGRETWSLLLGESADPTLVESIRRTAEAQPHVTAVQAARTMQLGPEIVHVDLDLHVDLAGSADELVATCRAIETAIRGAHHEVRRVSFRFPGP